MRRKQEAFTLIELLVVISIIAGLLAILLPGLRKSKELTRRAVCASRLRQIVLAMNVYTQNYDGLLPRFDMTTGWPPPFVHNVADTFLSYMNDNYDLNVYMFYCPSLRKGWVKYAIEHYKNVDCAVIGYGLWVPRLCNSPRMLFPPEHDSTWPHIVDKKPFRGPINATEPLARTNPVMTDDIYAKMIFPPDSDLSKDRDAVNRHLNHQWNGVMEMINQAFVDGSVQRVRGSELKARYGTGPNGSWQWR